MTKINLVSFQEIDSIESYCLQQPITSAKEGKCSAEHMTKLSNDTSYRLKNSEQRCGQFRTNWNKFMWQSVF